MALQFRGTQTDPSRVTLFQPIQPGIVIAAYIRCTSNLREPYAVYAQCGISTNDDPGVTNSKMIFIEGYVSFNRPLAWTGAYLMHPNDHFYLILTGDLTQSVNANVRRLPNIARSTLEELFAAALPTA